MGNALYIIAGEIEKLKKVVVNEEGETVTECFDVSNKGEVNSSLIVRVMHYIIYQCQIKPNQYMSSGRLKSSFCFPSKKGVKSRFYIFCS